MVMLGILPTFIKGKGDESSEAGISFNKIERWSKDVAKTQILSDVQLKIMNLPTALPLWTFHVFNFRRFDIEKEPFHFWTLLMLRNSNWNLSTCQLFDSSKFKLEPFHLSTFRFGLFDFMFKRTFWLKPCTTSLQPKIQKTCASSSTIATSRWCDQTKSQVFLRMKDKSTSLEP